MLRCSNLTMWGLLMLLYWGAGGGVPGARAQQSGPSVDPAIARQYREIVMDVLRSRLQSEVEVERGQVALKTPASRVLKGMAQVVEASVPYYLEGAMADFRRFRPRVKSAVEDIDGWQVPPMPRGWEEGEWTYFQVQGLLDEALLLIALDVGVFANAVLADDVQVREELARDWTTLRGGSDPLDTAPLPDFGGEGSDNSTLDGLGSGSGSGGGPGSNDVLSRLDAIDDRLARLENGQRSERPAASGGGFPQRGPDGGWQPGGSGQGGGLPDRLPESFTLQFPSGGAALGLSAEYGLNTLIEWMVALPRLRVLVTGHSDASGSPRANMELSRKRAQVVRYYLLERGIDPARVTAAHFGERRPEWGDGFDRRVEIQLLQD